jgi:uncharacterized protein
MTIFVNYHDDADGLAAAYAVWKKYHEKEVMWFFSSQYGDKPINLSEVAYVDPPDKMFIVDFSYPVEVCDEYAEQTELIIIDHHKTAFEDLKRREYLHYYPAVSGCEATWVYLFGYPYCTIPLVLRYIGDRDLWTFKMPHSKEVNQFIQLRLGKYDKNPVKAFFDFFEEFDEIEAITSGRVIRDYTDHLVNRICENAVFQKNGWFSFSEVSVNSPILQSEVGNELCKRYPDAHYARVFSYMKTGKVLNNLRSIGDFDVSELAKEMGGGGHKNAAGYISAQIR